MASNQINLHVTIISSLPPIIGLSPYTKGLVSALSKNVKINFLGFHHIYPPILYPGKMADQSAVPLPENKNLNIRNVLDWFNPLGWIIEAFRINTPIIHAQWWSFPLAPIYGTILGINRLRGKKIILTIHNVKPHERNLIKMLLNKSVFYLGNSYIVHTRHNKQELEKIIKNKEINVIPHGLIENPLKGISKHEARSILKIKESDKILLCFGHIRDYKGLDTALKALSLIKDQNIKLLISGKCWNGWEKYEKIIRQNNLDGRIILKLGYIPTTDIESIFRASDLVLLPYKHFDAQSGVGALVLPYDIPVIVSNTGGLSDYVADARSIVQPGNHQELALKIEKILNDKQLYAKLIRDIQEVKAKLSWEKIAQQTIEVYRNC